MNPNSRSVAELMSREPPRLEAVADVDAAMCAMEEARVCHLLIVRDGKLAGILTDRDISAWLPPPIPSDAAPAYLGKLARIRVSALMTHDPISTAPETAIEDAVAVMVEYRLSALPVIDTSGELVGLLTLRDVALGLLSARPAVEACAA